jgi:hypothetical protein
MNGLSFSATLSASYGFWASASPAMSSTDGFAFHRWRFAPFPTAF